MRKAKQNKRAVKGHCTVYALIDLEGRVRYIGQTRQAMRSRFSYHRRSAKIDTAPVCVWIRNGFCSGYEIIQQNAYWDISEALWIKAYRDAGARLLNVSKEHDHIYAAMEQRYEIRLKISSLRAAA